MLELRPGCEGCDCDLPPESPEARIRSFEGTFCASCAESKPGGLCPNCGGSWCLELDVRLRNRPRTFRPFNASSNHKAVPNSRTLRPDKPPGHATAEPNR